MKVGILLNRNREELRPQEASKKIAIQRLLQTPSLKNKILM